MPSTKFAFYLLPILALQGLQLPVQAQVVEAIDGTNTAVAPNGDITRGTPIGANLFHSFQQFDVKAGETANFKPDAGITNILGRVVGNAPSVINGTVQVTGNANLYLMNPAGLIFGQGAVLNVPGSFVGTTANAIGFGSDKWFNAVGANTYSDLTGNPTGFAFTTAQPGSIFNAANLQGIDPEPGSLAPGNRIGGLTLVGGTVVITGEIKIPGGNINIATVPGGKFIRLSQAGSLLSLDLPIQDLSAVQKGAINPTSLTPASLPVLLTNRPANEAAGVVVENGIVKLTGSNTVIAAGDIVSRDIDSSTSQALRGGDITLNAQTSIVSGDIVSSSLTETVGLADLVRLNKTTRGGDVSLSTQTDGIIVNSIDTSTGNFGIGGRGGNFSADSAKLFRVTGITKGTVVLNETPKDQNGKELTTNNVVSIYTSGNRNGTDPETFDDTIGAGKINITHRGNGFVVGGKSEINPTAASQISVTLTLPFITFPEGASGAVGAIIARNSNGNLRVVLKDGVFVGSNPGITDGFKITQLPPPPTPPPTLPPNLDQSAKKSKELCDRHESSTTIAANILVETRSASPDLLVIPPLDPCHPLIKGDRILKILDK
jgi:filamentous hemagglutinin family protein